MWVQGGTGVIQDGAFIQEWWSVLNKHWKKILQHIAGFVLSFVYTIYIMKSPAKKNNTKITKVMILWNP